MTTRAWYATARHLRALRGKLDDEGFEVLGASRGKHWMIYLRRAGQDATITIASTPSDPHGAVLIAMSSARKALPRAEEH